MSQAFRHALATIHDVLKRTPPEKRLRVLEREVGASMFADDHEDAVKRVLSRTRDLKQEPLAACEAILREEERGLDPA